MAGGRTTSLGPRALVGAALSASAAALVHGRCVAFGFTGLDDRDLVVDDAPFLSAPGSVLRAFTRSYLHVVDRSHGYYRPIVTASLALDARWSGAHAFGYHATNVALHAAASALLFLLLGALSMGPWPSLVGAIVFAVHPALAAAVAWIPGRNDSLLAVFALAAWIAFVRDAAAPSIRWRAAHLTAFGLALLTKETAVVIPLVCLAQAALVPPEPGARRPSPRRWVGYAAGWTVALAAFAALHAGLPAPAVPALGTVARVVVASAGKILVPFFPSAFASVEDLPVWPGVLGIAALAAASLRVPGVRRPVVLLGAVAFVVSLAPALALGGATSLDCRLEWPACGALVAVVEVARAAWQSRSAREGTLAAALAATTLAVLVAVTIAFEGSFRDPRSFATQAVDDAPHSALAHVCLGSVLQAEGDLDRAAAEYAAALSLGPAEIAHNNLAVIAMSSDRWADAERELRSEIALQPAYARAYENLAIVLYHEGRLDESRAAQSRADALKAP
jgi:hypothetical protein